MSMIAVYSRLPEEAGEYLRQIRTNRLPLSCTCDFSENGDFVRAVGTLLHSRRPLQRCGLVRDVTEAFCRGMEIPFPKLCFPLWERDFAYMTDSGRLSFSRWFLYRQDAERVVKVLIHELAHIAVKHHKDYIRVLRLELSLVADETLASVPKGITPVEYCGTFVSLAILEALGESLGDPVFQKIRADESAKLNDFLHFI